MDSDVVVVAPPGAMRSIPGAEVRVVGSVSGHKWEQVDLPRYLRRQGGGLLVNLASTAPLGYRHQLVTHHDITYVRHPESFSPTFRAIYRTLPQIFMRRNDGVITVSEFSKSEIVDHYRLNPESLHVVGNAADARFHQVERREDQHEPFFLAVSSPVAHKNFGRLVDAFQEFGRSSRTKLKIVGSVSSAFARQATANSGSVEFLGRLSDEDLLDHYARARAFVFPSLYEGFGIPPIEAQAAGCPVLSARAAAMPEVLGNSVEWFDPTSHSSIVDALRRVDADEDLRSQLSARGLANTRRFTWESSAERIHQLITSAK